MGKLSGLMQGFKPAIMMVAVQISLTGVNIFYKLAANIGFSLPVVIAYRFIFSVVAVIPIALIVERKSRPKLTWNIVFQAFICALLGGSMAQNLYAESLALTSATYTAATTNTMPAITFILAIFFRLERLGIKTSAGKAKIVGTLLCIGGAMLLTLYKGCQINIWSTNFNILHGNKDHSGHVAAAHHRPIDVFLGPLLAFLCCFSAAFSLIIQAKMSLVYPCHYSSTALVSVMGSLQAIVFALCIEKDWSQWKLGWNLRLLIAVYMGIFGAAMVWVFTMSAVRMRGPLFVSVFNPLLLVLVALVSSLILDEKLYLGSILGAAVIIFGLYSVVWGKSKEMKKITRLVPSKSFTQHNEQDNEGESFKGVCPSNINIMAVTPNFIPEIELSEPFDQQQHEEEKKEDLESKMFKPPTNV